MKIFMFVVIVGFIAPITKNNALLLVPTISSYTISGYITDESGNPIKNAVISISSSSGIGGSTNSDSNGYYYKKLYSDPCLSTCQPMGFTVRVSKNNLLTQTKAVWVNANGYATLNFKLLDYFLNKYYETFVLDWYGNSGQAGYYYVNAWHYDYLDRSDILKLKGKIEISNTDSRKEWQGITVSAMIVDPKKPTQSGGYINFLHSNEWKITTFNTCIECIGVYKDQRVDKFYDNNNFYGMGIIWSNDFDVTNDNLASVEFEINFKAISSAINLDNYFIKFYVVITGDISDAQPPNPNDILGLFPKLRDPDTPDDPDSIYSISFPFYSATLIFM